MNLVIDKYLALFLM